LSSAITALFDLNVWMMRARASQSDFQGI